MKNAQSALLLSNRIKILFLFISLFFCARAQINPIKTVVIDAGHGGKDPGCHGGYSNEKEVCLSMALKLGAMIKEKYPTIKVVYTREKDVFVELLERANIANRVKADLFICIHANAGSNAAYGSETYVLGLHRTEAQQKVMERENAIIELEEDKGAKYKNFDMSPEAIIAMQLQGAVYRDYSIRFADQLQKEFKKMGRFDRGVKEAGFYVLYKTAMPSVLIETGFLTNPSEEKLLASANGQIEMAQAMFKAFERYYIQISGTETMEVVKIKSSKEDILPDHPGNKNEPIKEQQDALGLIFKIQIETSDKKIPLNSSRFKNLDIYEYYQDGLFKYCTGEFKSDLQGARQRKIELIEQGFNNAFVAAFLNGERISIEKAIKLAENKTD
ncbi:MAG: N-acetylmuramoyl-L-alanine amidase [Bacteroidetes bacterium]|nr:N-acetylmuramoyl-L-alanine amidase [Bacteroidota bacterium]